MPVFRIITLSLCFLCIVLSAAGQTWRPNSSNTSVDLVAVHFTSPGRGWVAGDNGYLASTVDGGRTWKKYPLGIADNITEIYFRNEDNGYLVAGRQMFVTQDSGETWRPAKISNAGDFKNGTPEFLSIRFANKNLGLVIGSILNRRGDVIDSLLLRTSDGGTTWVRIILPTKAELFHLDFDGSSRGWIVGDAGAILATTDGGMTWRVQVSGTRVPLYSVDFRDDEEGYAVGKSGTILRSENGGATWNKVPSGVTDTLLRVDFPDDKNGWIVGYSGTVLRSNDRGRTWFRDDSGTKQNLYGLYMVKRFGWAVGASGTIVEYKK